MIDLRSSASSQSTHNPLLERISLKKVNLKQKAPPTTPKPYTSISKFCQPSKSTYQTFGEKVIKYEPRDLRGWRALLTTGNTILTNWTTWYKLCALTVVCFLTTGIVFLTDSQGSIGDIDVTSRVQLLLTFVLAGYVSYYVNYYNTVRHQYLGGLWGGLENLPFLSHQFFPITPHGNEEMNQLNSYYHSVVTRYCQSIFLLTFHACQNKSDLEFFVDRSLLTSEEITLLGQLSLGTRPLLIVGWLSRLFEDAYNHPTAPRGSFLLYSSVLPIISSIRGGVGGLLGVIGTPPPFMYTHLIYWIVQIFLLILAIVTGINLAVMWDRRHNGDEQYSYDDPNRADEGWPQTPRRYYVNFFLQQTAGNMIFAIFVEGLLYFCGEIENPLSERNTSFAMEVYEVYLENNCIALVGGRETWEEIDKGKKMQEEKEKEGLLSHGEQKEREKARDKERESRLPMDMMREMMRGSGQLKGSLSSHLSSQSVPPSPLKMKEDELSLREMRRKKIGLLNCQELGDLIGSLGEIYANNYQRLFLEKGITGEVFLTLKEDDLRDDFHIQEKYHLLAIKSLQSPGELSGIQSEK